MKLNECQATYPEPVGVLQAGGGVVWEHLQRDALLGDGDDGPLVHVRVVNSHPAENGERLDEVLVVLAEREVVELVDQLDDPDDLAGRVLDGHAQDVLVPEVDALVDAGVEARILVCVLYVDRLQKENTIKRVPITQK